MEPSQRALADAHDLIEEHRAYNPPRWETLLINIAALLTTREVEVCGGRPVK
jgi:hypothetical protein